ncbi:MAG: hypothetical protein FJ388_09650 [Verrucomicrobia bacterium]|nr:hypothetical protein [Verrucomicrobiota bacterium]
MLPTFANAMQRRGARIAGVKVGPVTLAHLYCLHAWESPFAVGGEIGLADFGLALWTLSRDCWPFDSYVAAVNRGVPDRWLARRGRRYRCERFGDDVAQLQGWLAWHCQTPPRFLKPQADDRGPSAPWPLVVAVQLIPVLGEARVWQMPVPLALAYKIAGDNAKGDTSWKSEAEQAMGYMTDGRSTQSNS